MSSACPECGHRSRGSFCARCGTHLRVPAESRSAHREGRRNWPRRPRVARALAGLAGLAGAVGVTLLLTDLPSGERGAGTAEDAGTVDVPATVGDPERLAEQTPADVRTQVGTPPELRCVEDRDCVRWRLPLPEGAQHGTSVTAGGLVIVASATGDANPVVAVDEQGQVQWERDDVDDRFANPQVGRVDVTVADGLVLVRPPGGIVAGFDDGRGRQLFKHRIEDLGDAELTTAERHEEVVVLVFEKGADAEAPTSLVALAAEDGQRRWHRHGQAAAVGAGMVSLLADGALYRIDPATGEPSWTRPVDADPTSATLVHLDDDRMMLSAGSRGPTHLVDAEGRPVAEIAGPALSIVGPGPGLLSVSAVRDRLAALDPDGQTRWTTPLTDDGGRPQILVTDAAIALVSPAGDAYRLLDPDTGAVRAQGELERPGRITGLLGPSTLLVRPSEGRDHATAVNVDDGRAHWQAEGGRLLTGLVDDAVLVVLGDELHAVALDAP
jgi:outer membrane protein assembly factor BamB